MPAPSQGRASARFIAIYALAYATLWLALLTPAIISLALRVRQLAPGNAAEPISRVLMTGAVVALVSNPIFGALSDRTRSRFGRRRPWLVGGVVCGCGALAVIGLAPTINIVLLGWCIAQLAYNAVLAALVAIVPDRIPPAQRGTVVGILGVCMPIGQIAGTYLVQELSFNMTWVLVVPGLIAIAGVLLLAIALPEEGKTASPTAGTPPAGADGVVDMRWLAVGRGAANAASRSIGPSRAPRAAEARGPSRVIQPDAPAGASTAERVAPAGPSRVMQPAAPARPSTAERATPAGQSPAADPATRKPPQPRNHRDFSWAWLSRVLFTTGSSFLQAYQPFLLIEKLGFDSADVPQLIFRSTLVGAIMVVIWSLLAGRLSDRTGLRKPFVMAGSVIQGLGLWLIAAADSYTMLLFGVALAGMGHGFYEGVDLALVTDVLPDRDQHAAKDLGLLNIANTLPQVIAPLSAPAILAVSRGDYTLVFAVAGAVAVLGAAMLLPLRNVR